MAAATLVDYSTTSPLFSSPELDRRKHSNLSSPALGSFVPRPSGLHSSLSSEDDSFAARPYASFSHSHTASASLDSPSSLQQQATHGKLHKKSHRKAPSSHSHRASTQSLTDPTLTRTDTPPIAEHDASHFAHTLPRAAPAPRSTKLRPFRKLSQSSRDASVGIDLSRTAEENLERSGIAVSESQTQPHTSVSPRLADVQFVRSHRHSRSLSTTSNQSAGSASFTPSMPFVHPMRQQRDAAPVEPSYTGSILGGDYSLSGLGIDTGPSEHSRSSSEARRLGSLSTVYSSTPRPGLSAADSDATILESDAGHNSHHSIYGSPTHKATHSRRGTLTSHKSSDTVPTPQSARTSFSVDRAASFMRTPMLSQKESAKDHMSSAEQELEREKERVASIQAARRAFSEREEAKTRKYEKQERKAAERRDRKRARAEERKRRKSDADEVRRPSLHRRSYSGGSRPSTRPRSSTAPNELEARGRQEDHDGDDTDSDIEEERSDWEDVVATPSESGDPFDTRHRRSSSHRNRASVTDAQPAPPASDPKISKKRQAKGGYFGLLTWFKVRMLHLSKTGNAR